VVEVNEGVGGPDALLQFFTRDHLTWTFQQDLQNLQWLFLQLDPYTPLAQFSGIRVNLEGTEANGP